MNVKTKQLLQRWIQTTIQKDMDEWPPDCWGWGYQAHRPTAKIDVDLESNEPLDNN